MLDLNPVQMVILGAIAVLLFGERLPEVARSMGKQLVQYKRAIQGIREQVTSGDQRLRFDFLDGPRRRPAHL